MQKMGLENFNNFTNKIDYQNADRIADLLKTNGKYPEEINKILDKFHKAKTEDLCFLVKFYNKNPKAVDSLLKDSKYDFY